MSACRCNNIQIIALLKGGLFTRSTEGGSVHCSLHPTLPSSFITSLDFFMSIFHCCYLQIKAQLYCSSSHKPSVRVNEHQQ